MNRIASYRNKLYSAIREQAENLFLYVEKLFPCAEMGLFINDLLATIDKGKPPAFFHDAQKECGTPQMFGGGRVTWGRKAKGSLREDSLAAEIGPSLYSLRAVTVHHPSLEKKLPINGYFLRKGESNAKIY